MMCINQILELTKSFFPIVLGLLLAYVAWQQMKTNRNKLKLDLFNKRIEIYNDTITFIQNVNIEGIPSDIHTKFINSRDASIFLFSKSPEIYELIKKIHSESFKVTGLSEIRKQPGISEVQLRQSVENTQQVSIWLTKQPEILRSKMGKYLAQ